MATRVGGLDFRASGMVDLGRLMIDGSTEDSETGGILCLCVGDATAPDVLHNRNCGDSFCDRKGGTERVCRLPRGVFRLFGSADDGQRALSSQEQRGMTVCRDAVILRLSVGR